jgi:hypothetical protein
MTGKIEPSTPKMKRMSASPLRTTLRTDKGTKPHRRLSISADARNESTPISAFNSVQSHGMLFI